MRATEGWNGVQCDRPPRTIRPCRAGCLPGKTAPGVERQEERLRMHRMATVAGKDRAARPPLDLRPSGPPARTHINKPLIARVLLANAAAFVLLAVVLKLLGASPLFWVPALIVALLNLLPAAILLRRQPALPVPTAVAAPHALAIALVERIAPVVAAVGLRGPVPGIAGAGGSQQAGAGVAGRELVESQTLWRPGRYSGARRRWWRRADAVARTLPSARMSAAFESFMKPPGAQGRAAPSQSPAPGRAAPKLLCPARPRVKPRGAQPGTAPVHGRVVVNSEGVTCVAIQPGPLLLDLPGRVPGSAALTRRESWSL